MFFSCLNQHSSKIYLNLNCLSSIRKCSSNPNLSTAKRKLIISEYELLRHIDSDKVPNNLDENKIDYLASLTKTLPSRHGSHIDISYRLRKYSFERLKKLETFEGIDSLVLPFTGYENEKLLRRKQLSQIPFLPNIVFDISFDNFMSSLECKNLAEQLILIFNLNKYGIDKYFNFNNLDLFNLHVTNLKSSKDTKKFLNSFVDTKQQIYYPTLFFHENSFYETFKSKKFIYLSPHANQVMKEYDPEAFYIIGGIVDRREIIELTPTRCKDLGIQSMKLPIELFVKKQVRSLYDVYKFLHEFKYNPESLSSNNISSFVKKHIKQK